MKILNKNNKYTLAFEFLVLCILLPTFIIYAELGKYMFFFLWAAAGYCAYHLFYVGHDNFAKDTWKWQAVNKANMKIVLARWLIACAGMIAFLYWYAPWRMFSMISRPETLLIVFSAYPLLSAFPQELIFCSFFFHRYKWFFTTDRARIIASAIVFAYAHVLYINPVAPALSFIGGIIFAVTYAKTRSLALVTIEHALYGNALFAIGLGYYFWSGAL